MKSITELVVVVAEDVVTVEHFVVGMEGRSVVLEGYLLLALRILGSSLHLVVRSENAVQVVTGRCVISKLVRWWTALHAVLVGGLRPCRAIESIGNKIRSTAE